MLYSLPVPCRVERDENEIFVIRIAHDSACSSQLLPLCVDHRPATFDGNRNDSWQMETYFTALLTHIDYASTMFPHPRLPFFRSN